MTICFIHCRCMSIRVNSNWPSSIAKTIRHILIKCWWSKRRCFSSIRSEFLLFICVYACLHKYFLFTIFVFHVSFLFYYRFFFYFWRYEKSALIYADIHSSFEEISLKFLQEWQIDALKTFLRKVIQKLFSCFILLR